jgi:hypothetical protein
MLLQQPLIGFTVRDESESASTLRFHIRRGTSASSGLSAATSLRRSLEPLITPVFVRQAVIYPAVMAPPPAPASGSTVLQVGVFIFSCVVPAQYAICEVPGFDSSRTEMSGPRAGIAINQVDPDVQAFVTEMLSGRWCNRFGYPLAHLEAAFMQVRE